MCRSFPVRWFVAGLLLSVSAVAAAPETTLILGQPTGRSVTVSARSSAPVEMFYETGTAPSVYATQTEPVTAAPDPFAPGFYVAQTVIGGLVPDTLYYYRLQSRPAGSTGAFSPGAEQSFHTQRQPGSTFVFCVQGDSHPERSNSMFSSDLYAQTLTAAAGDRPDFYLTSGDDFSVDSLPVPYERDDVAGRYTLQLPFLTLVARSAPLFLVTGNHEQTSLANYQEPPGPGNRALVPVWAQNARNLYYPMPAPDDPATGTFYSGNATSLPGIGLLRDYYAWEWGDALFVVLDPYWSSPVAVDNGLGGGKGEPKTANRWLLTHGDAQYFWLKQTLEQSRAKWKFVFAHHVMGTGRGGIELASQYEWGGSNADGTWGFGTHRPGWPLPIHQLMVQNRVTVFFQAHDHLFARQQLDGITYQELPSPADPTYTAFNATSYRSGDVLPNAGYLRVTVGPESVTVDYVREYLPQHESPGARSGTVAFTYTIGSPAQSAPERRRAVRHP